MRPLIDSIALTKSPAFKDHRWMPLVWLPYFLFFLLQPILEHATLKVWLIDAAAGAVFLFFFFGMFWAAPRYSRFFLIGMLLLGIGVAPINGGAATFFIYSAAFSPFHAKTEKGAIAAIALIVAIAALETWLLHLSWVFFGYAGGFAAVVGLGNIFIAQRNRTNEKLRMATEEIEHLAKVAERERIARDLHDVLGHTLSVIILKAELAGKLIDIDPTRAKAEIGDVEQTSRNALAEVRSTIRGYRSHSLEAELKHARAALETAGVKVQAETTDVPLTPAQESVLALVLREAVTNVVRHAQAHSCQVRLNRANANCLLEVLDDGCGGIHIEGNGLRGMRERIEALGGTLQRETAAGTKLTIRFPLAAPKTESVQ